jgi:hypothetical protein
MFNWLCLLDHGADWKHMLPCNMCHPQGNRICRPKALWLQQQAVLIGDHPYACPYGWNLGRRWSSNHEGQLWSSKHEGRRQTSECAALELGHGDRKEETVKITFREPGGGKHVITGPKTVEATPDEIWRFLCKFGFCWLSSFEKVALEGAFFASALSF